MIVVSKLGLDQFDEDDVRLLEVLAGHAAVAVENASLYEAARREAESATSLLEFGARARDAGRVSTRSRTRVTELSAEILGSRYTSFWLEHGRELRCSASTGTRRRSTEKLARGSAGRGAIGSRPRPVHRGARTTSSTIGSARRPCPAVATPSRRSTSTVGRAASSRSSSRTTSASASSRLLGGLAHQAKLAIANASSYEGLERTFVSTVEALANALEANDEYTSAHARWISDLSLRVGEELGLDERALKSLELGALLHDIGKIGIPSDILSKPGRLTAAERKLVQTHPELGERIIAPIDRLQGVRPIVRHCHERWDGCGYPDGVSGEDIPLESRIIFVCDAYHAMTTDRPYRRRLSHREACAGSPRAPARSSTPVSSKSRSRVSVDASAAAR